MTFSQKVRELTSLEWDVLMALRGPDSEAPAKYVLSVPLRWLARNDETGYMQLTPEGRKYGYYAATPSSMRAQYSSIDLSTVPSHLAEHTYAGYAALALIAQSERDSKLYEECLTHMRWLREHNLPCVHTADYFGITL